eukprot:TRINITY_DN2958_c0_g1_i8.p1 TRINITY_DN2958_c0_g1~~TRINITY_DN2958_c0_g1_i8.p1  ORF type:complete len:188 (+),score=17.36 TRINITY_DN2958_c0_g1_i8:609-1172(+)
MEGIISSEVIDEACRSCDLRHILDTISYSLIESKRRLQSLFEKECSKNQKWEYSGPLVTWGDLKRSQGVPVGGPMKVFKDAELSFRLAAISCLLVWCKNFKLEGQYSVVLLKEVVAYAKAHFSHLIRTEVDWEYMVRKLNMANILEIEGCNITFKKAPKIIAKAIVRTLPSQKSMLEEVLELCGQQS